MSKHSHLYLDIRRIVSSIPHGKVTTYGEVAKAVEIKDARLVGRAVHRNTDPQVPCHRLVKKDGSLALNYSEGDWKEDKMKLKSEDVEFETETKVNLKKHLWRFTK